MRLTIIFFACTINTDKGGFMLRIFILCVVALSIVVVGCSKKQDEVDKLQQEAGDDEAAAIMDSLSQRSQPPDTATEKPSEMQASRKPAEPEPTIPEPEPEYQFEEGFVVQVGSYLDRGLADYWAAKYRNWGYDASVQTADIGGEQYFRLRIGPFETYDEAKAIGHKLVDRYSADFWVDNSR
jgi:cell division protein FtsN